MVCAQLLLVLPMMLGCSGTPPSGRGTTFGIAPHSLTSDWVSTCSTVRGGVSGGVVIGGSYERFCAIAYTPGSGMEGIGALPMFGVGPVGWFGLLSWPCALRCVSILENSAFWI